jgi:predicted peptidase
VDDFRERTLTVADVAYAFQVWLPPGWTSEESWPVTLFLHGAGERGDDGVRQTTVGLGPALRRHPRRWRTVVVFPQARGGYGWRGPMLRQALGALDAALLEFRGDPARQCLTGISMGGFGTWRLALENPDRFAALVPICGGVDLPPGVLAGAGAGVLASVPTWIFHGRDDPTIPVEESRVIFEALRRAGADPRYTEYPGVAHNSWDLAYEEPRLPEWLLQQHR